MTTLTFLWNVIIVAVSAFVFVVSVIAVISVISDLIRDRSLSGFAKALWIIVLVIVPLLGALIYLIARGGGMAERAALQRDQMRKATDAYIRDVAASPTDEIAKAKQLLDAGALTAEEFTVIKQRALAA